MFLCCTSIYKWELYSDQKKKGKKSRFQFCSFTYYAPIGNCGQFIRFSSFFLEIHNLLTHTRRPRSKGGPSLVVKLLVSFRLNTIKLVSRLHPRFKFNISRNIYQNYLLLIYGWSLEKNTQVDFGYFRGVFFFHKFSKKCAAYIGKPELIFRSNYYTVSLNWGKADRVNYRGV